MKFASLVLSGLLLALVAGCSSGGDGGRVNELTADVGSLEERLETSEAALMKARADLATAQTQLTTAQTQLTTARSDLTTARSDLTTTRAELTQAQTDLTTARTALQTAQANLTARQNELEMVQSQLTSTQSQLTSTRTENTNLQNQVTQIVQEESDAEAITRAFGLLEAMDPDTRGAGQTGRGDTNIERQHAATVLAETHPMEGAPRSPKITNLGTGSLRLGVMADGEFSSAGGIPSLSMGGTSLRSTRLTRDDPANKTQDMVLYTDFRPRSMRLLDAYLDERPEDPADDSQKLNVITLANTATDTAMGINEKAGDPPGVDDVDNEERFANAGMYEAQDMTLVLQPRLSGVTLPRTGTQTLPASAYSLSYEYVFDDDDENDPLITTDDHYDISIIRSFPANLRGVSGQVRYRYAEIDGSLTREDPTDLTSAITKGCLNRSGALCRPDPGDADDVTLYNIPEMSFMVTTAAGSFERYAIAGAAPWTFDPNSDGATVWLDDGQYLYFGWWQETPDEADGVYDLHIIADGVGRWLSANTPAIGTAVYTGPAVGKYVRTLSAANELDHAGERRRNAVQGTFTANTRLEADFVPASDPNDDDGFDIKGTITNFRDGGTAIPGNWQVNLGSGAMGTEEVVISFGTGTDDDLGGTPTAVIVQGGQAGALPTEDQTGQGTWELTFFQDEDTAALYGLDTPVPSHPAAAVGKFDVGLEHVIHFSGAFGVAKN